MQPLRYYKNVEQELDTILFEQLQTELGEFKRKRDCIHLQREVLNLGSVGLRVSGQATGIFSVTEQDGDAAPFGCIARNGSLLSGSHGRGVWRQRPPSTSELRTTGSWAPGVARKAAACSWSEVRGCSA
jgi:hypothetical protein